MNILLIFLIIFFIWVTIIRNFIKKIKEEESQKYLKGIKDKDKMIKDHEFILKIIRNSNNRFIHLKMLQSMKRLFYQKYKDSKETKMFLTMYNTQKIAYDYFLKNLINKTK